MQWHRIAYVAVLLVAPTPTIAQGYLSGTAANKKLVSDFYRLVYEPRNVDLIEQYVAPDFIDHDPNSQGGRDSLVKFIKSLPVPPSGDVGEELKNPPALVVAESDLVTFVFEEKSPNPKGKSNAHDRFTFDVFRIKNGKIVEHWDSLAR